MQNESYWIKSSKGKTYPKLDKNIETNCLVVGGGIAGLTTAYLLAKGGEKVVLVEADKIGHGSSGRNTGKVSTQHNIIYSKINHKYDLKTAYLYYEANEKALKLIEKIINENNIDCNFEKMPSYIYTENENYLEDMKDEYEVCKKIGIECEYHEKLDLPLDIKAAISFKNQAQFNPKKYLDELAKISFDLGVKIYENTPIIDIKKGDICELKTKEDNIIEAKKVIIASHVPWYDGLNFYFAKQKGDRSYLLTYDLKNDFEKGMFLNVEDPSRTFRIYEDNNEKLLIIGGEKHKVGQGKKEALIYEELDKFSKEKFGVKDIKYKWSAQDYMSFDDMPYIGHINKKSNNIYVATGFCKWGITNGTLAGMIISDLILKEHSKYHNIFETNRKGSFFTKDFIKENMNVAVEYIGGKLRTGSKDMPIEKGEGKVVNIDGKRYGAYRNFDNQLYIVDITCTHLGCELVFNGAEKTWDCPCHASRFDYEGNILEGPALRPLNKYNESKNKVDPKIL